MNDIILNFLNKSSPTDILAKEALTRFVSNSQKRIASFAFINAHHYGHGKWADVHKLLGPIR